MQPSDGAAASAPAFAWNGTEQPAPIDGARSCTTPRHSATPRPLLMRVRECECVFLCAFYFVYSIPGLYCAHCTECARTGICDRRVWGCAGVYTGDGEDRGRLSPALHRTVQIVTRWKAVAVSDAAEPRAGKRRIARITSGCPNCCR